MYSNLHPRFAVYTYIYTNIQHTCVCFEDRRTIQQIVDEDYCICVYIYVLYKCIYIRILPRGRCHKNETSGAKRHSSMWRGRLCSSKMPCILTNSSANGCSSDCMCAHADAHTHTYTHAHNIHTQTYTHTSINTHTHTHTHRHRHTGPREAG